MRGANLARGIAPLQLPSASNEALNRLLLQSASVRKQPESQEVQALFGRRDLRLVRVQLEAAFEEGQAQLVVPVPKLGLAVAKQHQVIAIADVPGDAPMLSNQVIDGVQEDIGKELAGQVANGEPAGPLDGEQVVSGEPVVRGLGGQYPGATRHDLFNQGEERPVADAAVQFAEEHCVVEIRKKPDDVGLQKKRELSQVLLGSAPRTVRSLAAPTGITVGGEDPFVEGFEHIDDGMMDHAIPKGSRADQAGLRIQNAEAVIRPGAPAPVAQFPLQLAQVIFP